MYVEPTGATEKRPLILIVDDEEPVRRALGRNLSRLGCDVLVAGDGEFALKTAIEASPAVIFLDLRLPGIDGHALLRQLPASGVQASIVVMSGQGNVDDVVDALRMGAVDFLKKPGRPASWPRRWAGALTSSAPSPRRRRDRPPRRRHWSVRPAAPPCARHAPIPTGTNCSSACNRRRWRCPASPGRSPTCTAVRAISIPPTAPARPPSTRWCTCSRAIRAWPPPSCAWQTAASSPTRKRRSTSAPPSRASGRAWCTPSPRPWRCATAIRPAPPSCGRCTRRSGASRWGAGLAMRAIAEVTGPEVALDPDRCYLGGLLLDASADFLLWALDESRREPPVGDTVTAATAEVLSSYHPAFGQAVLARWGMPADLVALARDHHAAAPPGPRSPMWAAAQLARPMAARLLGFDDPTSSAQPRPELLDRCAYDLGVGDTVLRRLSATLADDARAHWELYA